MCERQTDNVMQKYKNAPEGATELRVCVCVVVGLERSRRHVFRGQRYAHARYRAPGPVTRGS